MSIAVRFQSRGGNTKAVAEAIAKAAGVAAESIDAPISEPVDMLFVGGGIYAWALDDSLKDFLNTLSADNIKCVVPFSTGGTMSCAGRIAAIAKTKGIAVYDDALSVRMGLRNYGGRKGGVTLTDKQLGKINDFVNRTKDR